MNKDMTLPNPWAPKEQFARITLMTGNDSSPATTGKAALAIWSGACTTHLYLTPGELTQLEALLAEARAELTMLEAA